MNDAEVKRLAHAINELRPSWPISSLTTFIARNLSNRVYRDAAVALVYVALDADMAGNYLTQTPKRVLEGGPWWKVVEYSGGVTANRARAPKRSEECRTHVGQFADNCGGCHADQLAESDEPPTERMSKDAALAAARAALREGASA